MNKIFTMLISGLFVTLTSNAFAKDTLTDVELMWKGTSDLKEFSGVNIDKMSSHKIAIEKFKDNRKNPARVGENRESKEILPVETTSDVAGFVTDNLKTTLTKAGLDIAKDKADYTLTGEINDYFITETTTYKGNITLKLRLNKGGKTVWQGVVRGNNSRFGKSYKLDNYLESLSDVIVDAGSNLVKNDGFQKAF